MIALLWKREERKKARQAEYQESLKSAEQLAPQEWAKLAEAEQEALPIPPVGEKEGNVNVRTYRITGEQELQETIQKFLVAGWEVLSVSTRKQAWNPMVGVFTSNQVHTVTFVRR
jgi:hypothetical protein